MQDAYSCPWQHHLPQNLQNYQLNLETLHQNLAELSTLNAARYPEHTAMSIVLANGLSHSLSFAQLDQYATALANYLQQHLQLNAGDVVALQLPNSLHYPIAVFACWKVGLIISNVNPLYTARELDYQVQDSGAKALIVCDLFLNTFEQVLAKNIQLQHLQLITTNLSDFFAEPYQSAIAQKLALDAQTQQRSQQPSINYSTFVDAMRIGADLPRYQAQSHNIAAYQYTGGTTGRSKGAIISHQNLAALITTTRDYLHSFKSQFNQDDVILTAIPLYHIFAFTVNF